MSGKVYSAGTMQIMGAVGYEWVMGIVIFRTMWTQLDPVYKLDLHDKLAGGYPCSYVVLGFMQALVSSRKHTIGTLSSVVVCVEPGESPGPAVYLDTCSTFGFGRAFAGDHVGRD